MKVTMCDRCGAIIKKGEEISSGQGVKQDHYIITKLKYGFFMNFQQDIDLCEDCQASLAEWLYMGKKEDADGISNQSI